jgi:hypothetical protein
MKPSMLTSSLAAVLSFGLLAPPAVLAQDDDDMPDGDVDIIEQKKKPSPKKDPPKKAPEKPAEKPKPKKPPPKAEDDILTGDPLPAVPPPKKAPPPPAVSKDVMPEGDDDDDEDEDDDDEPPSRVPEAVGPTQPVHVREVVDDDLPARARVPETQPVVDEAPVPVPAAVMPRRSVQDVEEPGESEGAPTGLIVGGAIGGALVLLAGAGVGGYFLFTSLQSGGVTVIVQPK